MHLQLQFLGDLRSLLQDNVITYVYVDLRYTVPNLHEMHLWLKLFIDLLFFRMLRPRLLQR